MTKLTKEQLKILEEGLELAKKRDAIPESERILMPEKYSEGAPGMDSDGVIRSEREREELRRKAAKESKESPTKK